MSCTNMTWSFGFNTKGGQKLEQPVSVSLCEWLLLMPVILSVVQASLRVGVLHS